MRVLERYLDAGAGGDRPPYMVAVRVEREGLAVNRRWNHAHRTADAAGDRNRDLIEADGERRAIPVKPAGADGKSVRAAGHGAARPLRHGPAGAAVAVDRDIDGAMVERIGRAAAARKGVIGREHAADEGDDGDAIFAVVAQRVDIPPSIAVFGDWTIEPKSAIRLAAAERPDSAAIGTPGPGCVLPPARYRPGILVRAPGR